MAAQNGVNGNKRPNRYQKWMTPPFGWLKINVDGSLFQQTEEAMCAGVFHDENGMWILGFGRKLGTCTSLQVELWGINITLELAWDRNLQQIIVECNNMEAMNLINSICPSLHYASEKNSNYYEKRMACEGELYSLGIE